MKETLEILAFIILTGLVSFIVYITCYELNGFTTKRLEKKRQGQHPQFYKMQEQCRFIANKKHQYYKQNIKPLKNKIDNAFKDKQYYPKEVLEKKSKEVEELRKELWKYEAIYRAIDKKHNKMIEKIHQYVIDNNMDWAIKQGW